MVCVGYFFNFHFFFGIVPKDKNIGRKTRKEKLMRKKVLLAGVFMAVLFYGGNMVYAADHKYVGTKKCSMCHKSEAKGNPYGKWLSSAHAKAYEKLGSPEAKEAATKAGVTGNPQQDQKCLKCHVTAYGVDASLLGEGFVKEEGVQCEACHGAGSDYMAMSVMKDKAKSVEAGLTASPKEGCVKCHNQESPTFKGFNLDEYYKKIDHSRPK